MNRKETLTLIEDRDYWKKLYKELSDKNTQLEKDIKEWEVVNECWEDVNTRLIEQNKRYREALEFYANRDNYKLEHFDPNINDYMSTVDYDEGQKARKVLEGEE